MELVWPLLFVLALVVSICRWFTWQEWCTAGRLVRRGLPTAIVLLTTLLAMLAFASSTGALEVLAQTL
ncbi:hypothetical protein [Piscinibacter gummiphilus]|uniref:Uncharacterized protein n=1 Tax=Piscinibacter gummiphilus TaxID=946333 RepID=A0ABZ0CUC2_9BURK|nr:hypothetical protein [Piscinibacter gummiphilus]WOB06555.1 hypothetical protein RXV79_16675 [Piscinibacter gummiphilus]